MKIAPDLAAGIAEIARMITARLTEHEEQVVATLRDAASGALEMPETISEAEKQHAQKLFGWVADHHPATSWASLQPILSEALADPEAVYHQILLRKDAAGADRHHTPIKPHIPLLEKYGAELVHNVTAKQKRELERLAVLLLSYIFYEDFHYPQPGTGVYNIAGDLFEKVKWAYRYWFNQLEVAEKDSGLEEFFADQVLDFPAIPLDGPVTSEQRITVTCAGDLLAVDVLTPENSPQLFDGIADFFSTADIVSANLESTVDGDSPVGRTQASGEPARMNTSKAMFDKFRNEAGINFFSTATNHALDWGEQGVRNTLDVLADSGALYRGTAAGQAGQDRAVVFESDGLTIGLLTFTFDLNGHPRPVDKPWIADEVRFNDAKTASTPGPDYALVEQQVAAAKAAGADYIIAYCHWGWEFEMYPHVNITEAAREVVARGVDVILGNHPHVSQPGQVIERGGQKDPNALVTYAFGDFVSYHPESRNSKLAYAIKFDIVKAQSATETVTYLTNLRSLPIYIVNAKHADAADNAGPGDPDGTGGTGDPGGSEGTGSRTHDCRIVKFDDVLANPDGYGLTDRERSELRHLDDVVWKRILSPISRLPRE